MKKKLLRLILITCFFLIPPANAQQIKGAHWQINLSDSSVYKTKKLKQVINDTLMIIVNNSPAFIAVNSIDLFSRIKNDAAHRGIVAGAATGFTGGVLLVLANSDGYDAGLTAISALGIGALAAIPGLFIGGIIGAASSHNKVYRINELKLEEKTSLIRSHCKNKIQ